MAAHNKSQTSSQPAVPGSAAIRMGSLAGGGLGLLGFALAVFAGLSARNGISEILQRAIVTCMALAAVGGLAGLIGGQVIHEQLQRQADLIRKRNEAALAELAGESVQNSKEIEGQTASASAPAGAGGPVRNMGNMEK